MLLVTRGSVCWQLGVGRAVERLLGTYVTATARVGNARRCAKPSVGNVPRQRVFVCRWHTSRVREGDPTGDNVTGTARRSMFWITGYECPAVFKIIPKLVLNCTVALQWYCDKDCQLTHTGRW
jgi:hypothetical protein